MYHYNDIARHHTRNQISVRLDTLLILQIDVAPTGRRISHHWPVKTVIPRVIDFAHEEGEGMSNLSRQCWFRGFIRSRDMLPSIPSPTDVTQRSLNPGCEVLKDYLFLIFMTIVIIDHSSYPLSPALAQLGLSAQHGQET